MRALLPGNCLLWWMLAACSQPSDPPEAPGAPASSDPIPVEPDGGMGDGAPPLPEPTPDAANAPRTMPERLRRSWREDDLGRAPTPADCDQTARTNRNFGRVLTIREDGYSLFEQGGRIIEVDRRSETMIAGTFDTTYADMPTTARTAITFRNDGSLLFVTDEGGDDRIVRRYLPCPEG